MLILLYDMSAASHRQFSLEIPWKTIWRLLLAAALVWCVFQLYRILLTLLVAIVFAVLLDPLVGWFERRGLSRGRASLLVSLGILLLLALFLWAMWASLVDQAQHLVTRLGEVEQQLRPYLPRWITGRLGMDGRDLPPATQTYALRLAQSAGWAVTYIVFGYVLTIYLLIDWRRTYEWVLAFVPRPYRARCERTLEECREVMFAYMKGNVITSIIAAVCTLVPLWILGVPAALLLALISGLSDFVPVIGFVVSAIPAILLALTVSTGTALWVVVVYIAYNTIENYVISPWAYGSRMRLSDLAVLIAFAVGAELGGVIGALLSLPLAASYPTVERMWLRSKLPEETVEEHREIERRPG